MNMNDAACEIAEREGLKIELPVGQIKEVLKCVRQLCYLNPDFKAAIMKYLRVAK